MLRSALSLEPCSIPETIKKQLTKQCFKRADNKLTPGETPFTGNVWIYINEVEYKIRRCLLRIHFVHKNMYGQTTYSVQNNTINQVVC